MQPVIPQLLPNVWLYIGYALPLFFLIGISYFAYSIAMYYRPKKRRSVDKFKLPVKHL